MSLWWLQPGWTETACSCCGEKIWPEGDPDWGMCVRCFTEKLEYEQAMREANEQQLQQDQPPLTGD